MQNLLIYFNLLATSDKNYDHARLWLNWSAVDQECRLELSNPFISRCSHVFEGFCIVSRYNGMFCKYRRLFEPMKRQSIDYRAMY